MNNEWAACVYHDHNDVELYINDEYFFMKINFDVYFLVPWIRPFLNVCIW